MVVPAILIAGVLTALIAPRVLGAQAAAEQLLGKMEDVGLHVLLPKTLNDGVQARTGYGIEFSFMIGERRQKLDSAARLAACDEAADPPHVVCDSATAVARKRTMTQVRISGHTADTTFTIEELDLVPVRLRFELTVGTRMTELRGSSVVTGWELGGRIQEFPTLTIYSTFNPDGDVSPYAGLTFTPADLKGVKLTQGDSAATVEANAVGGALAAGLVGEIASFNIFAQAEYAWLRFRTPVWKRPLNFPATQPPAEIDLTGLRFSAGVQIPLGGKK